MADGNRLVLGPLTAEEIAPVAAVTRAAKVPMLTYTGDAGVAARDIFVLGTMTGIVRQLLFSDGIAEEILNALTSLKGLRVAARTSAFSFRGKSDDLRAIGEKLNAGR